MKPGIWDVFLVHLGPNFGASKGLKYLPMIGDLRNATRVSIPPGGIASLGLGLAGLLWHGGDAWPELWPVLRSKW